MAFSYPSAVIIPFIMIVVLIAVERKISRQTVFYILGGASTAVIALAILLAYVGFDHLIYGLNSVLSIRSVNETSEGRNAFVEYVYQVVKAFVSIQRFLILPGILLVIVFLKSIKQKKYIWLLLWGIFLCAFINYIYAVPKIKESYAGLNNFIGYVAVWAPFLYYLIPENQKKQKSKMLLYCLWLPAIVSAVAVSMVSIPSEEHGALKSWEAFLKTIFLISLKKIAWKLPRNGKQIFHQNYSPRYTKIYRETEKLFQRYKKEAALVVTSRLHCASPCRALGIPTILEMEENLRGLHGLKESAYLHTG